MVTQYYNKTRYPGLVCTLCSIGIHASCANLSDSYNHFVSGTLTCYCEKLKLKHRQSIATDSDISTQSISDLPIFVDPSIALVITVIRKSQQFLISKYDNSAKELKQINCLLTAIQSENKQLRKIMWI